MKRLEIALTALGGTFWLGGAYYIRNIAHSLRALPKEESETFRVSVLLRNEEHEQTYADLAPFARILRNTDQPSFTLANRVRWKAIRALTPAMNPRFEEFLEDAGIDFVYSDLLRSRGKGRVRQAAWLPDFQHHHFPEASNAQEVRERIEQCERTTRLSSRVVLSSAMAERDCHELFPISRGKTFVLPFRVEVPNPPFDDGAVLRKYNLPSRYFIVANAFAPTKNHKFVFEAMQLLNASGIRVPVVFTGNLHDYRNPNFISEIVQAIHHRGVHSQAFLLGVVPRADQIQLMRRAIAVIQPSLFEGWSTCVEESRCLGRPILLSDFPVHLEQNPPLGQFFDRRSPKALTDAMRSVWEQPDAPSGPEVEEQARRDYQNEVVTAGRRFLQLARLS